MRFGLRCGDDIVLLGIVWLDHAQLVGFGGTGLLFVQVLLLDWARFNHRKLFGLALKAMLAKELRISLAIICASPVDGRFDPVGTTDSSTCSGSLSPS